VNSNVADMLKWDQAVYSRTFFKKESWEEILTPGLPTEASSIYGFGWNIVNPDGKGRIAYHSGGWPGYIAYNEQGLDFNYSIIILRNKFTPNTRMPIAAIREIIAKK